MLSRFVVAAMVSCLVVPAGPEQIPPNSSAGDGLEFIDTSFENASPLWHERAADGTVLIHLIYDYERASPNRAAGHVHFMLQGRTGAKLTLEFKNLDNVWNGKPGSVAGELKTMAISENGRDWKPIPTESLPGNRVRLIVEMPGPRLYVARLEPYRLSDLDRLIESIRTHPLVQVTSIGKTAGGRELEIVRIGRASAPYRVFVRGRAHPWESGSSWVVEGLIRRLVKGDRDAQKFLERYSVDVIPMANKDGVARGMTRFNLMGKDLNRNWDKPADSAVSPENAALEKWLENAHRGRPPAAFCSGAAQRRPWASAHQQTARPAVGQVSRAYGDIRSLAAEAHLVHGRQYQRSTSATAAHSVTAGSNAMGSTPSCTS